MQCGREAAVSVQGWTLTSSLDLARLSLPEICFFCQMGGVPNRTSYELHLLVGLGAFYSLAEVQRMFR